MTILDGSTLPSMNAQKSSLPTMRLSTDTRRPRAFRRSPAFRAGSACCWDPRGGYLLGFAVVPFVVPDAIKVALSVGVAERVNRALGAALER